MNLHTLEKNTISIQLLPLCLLLFFAFSPRVLNSGIKKCFDRLVFQDAVCEECFSNIFDVSTFTFCYCFYDVFIHKIVLVSRYLLFSSISYPFKVFKFDTEVLRHSCAVSSLKTFSRLLQSIAFLCLILFLIFAWNNFPFRVCNNYLLDVSRSVAESHCSTGFSCTFSWLWANQCFLNFRFRFR